MPKDHRNDIHASYGRCRSGRRWFWHVHAFDRITRESRDQHGWSDDEDQALADARSAVAQIAGDRPAFAYAAHGCANEALKDLNKARRLAQPPSDAKGSRVVEYLYGQNRNGHDCKFQILKKTKQRIYYAGRPIFAEDDYSNIRDFTECPVRFVNRQKLERDGEIWSRRNAGWWEADARLLPHPTSATSSRTGIF